ncbi:SCP-like extracellular [Microcoleus sp. LEGE 07076]|uniref:CAP domain-containing protein n=1 Tax=Microcoleus sp. LEGE 07076 TaxID=915322 RepID=UPI0018819796|nr:CAP domain-containing protein [Microcoleus sp. LEGE 07076]MBE9183961.1 SCP-like extracellular [Microcoleus sp. LEGE 07076]
MIEQNSGSQSLDILTGERSASQISQSPTNQNFIYRVLELTNIERSKLGLSPLTLNTQLLSAAQTQSQNMALQDFFSHTGKDGSSTRSRITATGYQFRVAAENIAAGSSTPEQVVEGWMNSSGHRTNILNPNLKEIGIGYYFLANDTGTENRNHYWTQVFATSVDGSVNAAPTTTTTPTPTPTPTPNTLVAITSPIPNAAGEGNPTPVPKNTASGGNYFLSDSGDTQIPTTAAGLSIFALSGKDSLMGGDGVEIINGMQGADTLNGAGGNDSLWGGKESDLIDGGVGNDFISGNNDNDRLIGSDGNDTIRGGKEDDILIGGNGSDLLGGDRGQDILTGGDGNDTFILAGGLSAAAALISADVITDFGAGDKIGLTDGIGFANLTFEAVSLQLDGGASVASTAIKSGSNYLGIVQGVSESQLASSVFVNG